MQYPEQTLTLKNGQTALFRVPDPPQDAEAALECFRASCGETNFLSLGKDEVSLTAEDEMHYLKSALESPDRLMLMCFVDGRMAGNAQLMRLSTCKTRHRGVLMIGLRREFWGLGLGTALFRTLMEQGKRMGLAQLELEVLEGNERAIALYRKMGFSVMAEHPDAFRTPDGQSHKAIFMRCVLS